MSGARPTQSNLSAWHLAIQIWLIGVNVISLEQYFHRSLVPILNSPHKRCMANAVFLIDVTTFHSYQTSYNLNNS